MKPAAITNGATTAAASGTTAAKVRDDVKAAKKAAIVANQSLASAAWIMHPATALALESMVNSTTSVREFPLINSVTGGFFEGLPVVISTNVPGDDTNGYDVVLAVQSEILYRGRTRDRCVAGSVARNGQRADAKRRHAGTASLVSLWQTGKKEVNS